MKRFLLPLAALALCHAATAADGRGNRSDEETDAAQTAAAAHPEDSLRMYRLQAIEVTATRATASTPVAYSQLSREEIDRSSYGTDIPSVLALTPSMIATNETGIGIGGTSMRLRGTDATRLNVTINGVAMNNPDSHAMYWYDTPDLLSAVGDMQIQRGAGISTNGTGAFGGAVSMTTEALSTEFGGSASLSYGSYNTNKQAVQLSSGLLGGHWALDARLTHIGSDGYIDRGATDLKSYMFQAGYYGGNTMIKLLSFGGKAKTYLTYTGATKEEMALYGRRYHTEGQYVSAAGPYLLADGTPVAYYDDHTDNYLQINNQLLLSHRFNDRWTMNATGFYTYGYGFYKQYKDSKKLGEYLNIQGLAGSEKADLIRSKTMRNHLGGLHAAAHYASQRLALTFGGSYSYYSCPHWGTLEWVEGLQAEEYAGRWYDNDVDKHDANLFARAQWTVTGGLDLFADLQYRYVGYRAWGVNDNYDKKTGAMQPIDVDEQYHFFNPHLGLSYTRGRHTLYASFAIAQKEPTRSDFTDRYMFAADDTKPRSETLYDYELGYTYRAPKLDLGANLYYMKYRDQLVPTGMVNDGSESLNINVPDSYRLGIELSAAWRPLPWLTVGANATWSRNKIEHYVDLLADSPTYGQDLGTKTIAYSPDWIASGYLDFHYRGFGAVVRPSYVSRQYFTNNENEALTLDGYSTTNLDLSYTLRTGRLRSVRFGVTVYNLFDQRYESNGYGYSYMDTWREDAPKRIDEAYYFPQAPLHVLANVTVRF